MTDLPKTPEQWRALLASKGAEPFAYEVTLKSTINLEALEHKLLEKGYLFGQRLDDNHVIFYASESKSKADIDTFVSLIKELAYGL